MGFLLLFLPSGKKIDDPFPLPQRIQIGGTGAAVPAPVGHVICVIIKNADVACKDHSAISKQIGRAPGFFRARRANAFFITARYVFRGIFANFRIASPIEDTVNPGVFFLQGRDRPVADPIKRRAVSEQKTRCALSEQFPYRRDQQGRQKRILPDLSMPDKTNCCFHSTSR